VGGGRACWTKAEGLAEQEKAVDGLLSTWERDNTGQLSARVSSANAGGERDKQQPEAPVPPRDAPVFRFLASGKASEAHRQALRFAAGEYERLLGLCPPGPPAAGRRQRLADKAKALRDLAAR
jgi:hypothetical protein